MVISSVSNKTIMLLSKLHNKKYRDSEKLFLVEGEHLVLEAYKKGLLKEVFLLENTDFDHDINKNYVTSEVMKKITSLDTIPSIIGLCNIVDNKIDGNRIVLLDNIQDPGNLGTIIRNSVAFNISTIVLSLDTVDLYNSKVLRSAQGMNFHINIVVSDLKETIMEMKKNGFNIYGTSLKNAHNLSDVSIKKPFGLVFGNEGNGVSNEILDLCDENIYVEISENCESLNVGVAAGIILYKISR